MCNDVICPYKGKCTREGTSCNSCERNAGKKDYYLPKRDWYTPYYPYWTPWYPTTSPYPYPYITYIASDSTGTISTDRIFSTNIFLT